MKEKALVDVPVAINVWIRHESFRLQVESLCKAKPSILFLVSDMGRNEDEKNKVKANRKYIEKRIDWECIVYKLYENDNKGLYQTLKKCWAFIWEKVDRCIYLEDDLVPSVSFFEYCRYLLEKYKDDERIEAVCGHNHMNTWNAGGADYFFSTGGAIWGYATWKRCYMLDKDVSYYSSDSYFMNYVMKNKSIVKDLHRILGYVNDDHYEGHIPGIEFWWGFNIFANNRMYIMPSKNLVSCYGADNSSENFDDYDKLPDYLKKLFYTKTYELSFPLREPRFMFNDKDYEYEAEKAIGLHGCDERFSFIVRIKKKIKHFFFRNSGKA